MINYQNTQKYLDSFINYERKIKYNYKYSFKLERFIRFLEEIGQPQEKLKVIHIAGTKGKGSACAFVAYMLRQAGFRVGLYTSPHLISVRERIRILEPQIKTNRDCFEGMIDEEELTLLVNKLKPSIERFNQKSIYGPLSFFEVYTALAFMYFKQKKPDFCVLETGLGGRLDATNVIERPLCTALTPISYEHMQKLGYTLKEIAKEKCGIIKEGIDLVSAPQDKEAERVIRAKCQERNARLIYLGKDIVFSNIRHYSKEEIFDVQMPFSNYQNLKIKLLGQHQVINASLALGIIDSLKQNGLCIREEDIRKGLVRTVWPGRLEVLAQHPQIILDGAQNAASAQALCQAIKERCAYKKAIIVLGISKDKDLKGILKHIELLGDEFILTRADNPRAQEPVLIKKFFSQKNKISLTKNTKEALALAQNIADKEDLILITGSLFVVGEARQILKKCT